MYNVTNLAQVACLLQGIDFRYYLTTQAFLHASGVENRICLNKRIFNYQIIPDIRSHKNMFSIKDATP